MMLLCRSQGDSGGPLVRQRVNGQWELLGIVSWGSSYCNAPGVYVDVYNIKSWIESTTNSAVVDE